MASLSASPLVKKREEEEVSDTSDLVADSIHPKRRKISSQNSPFVLSQKSDLSVAGSHSPNTSQHSGTQSENNEQSSESNRTLKGVNILNNLDISVQTESGFDSFSNKAMNSTRSMLNLVGYDVSSTEDSDDTGSKTKPVPENTLREHVIEPEGKRKRKPVSQTTRIESKVSRDLRVNVKKIVATSSGCPSDPPMGSYKRQTRRPLLKRKSEGGATDTDGGTKVDFNRPPTRRSLRPRRSSSLLT